MKGEHRVTEEAPTNQTQAPGNAQSIRGHRTMWLDPPDTDVTTVTRGVGPNTTLRRSMRLVPHRDGVGAPALGAADCKHVTSRDSRRVASLEHAQEARVLVE